MDVHQPRHAEGKDVAVAGGELLAAGVVRAVAELVARPAVVLGAGHVPARHDGEEHQPAGHEREPAEARPAVHRRRAHVLGLRGPPHVQHEREQRHRQAEVRGHEALIEVLLHGGGAEEALCDHQHGGADAGPHEPAMLAVAPIGHHREDDHHHADDPGQHPVRVLDHRIEIEPRHDIPIAERPPREARPRRPAPQPRIRDPHHSTNQNQRERQHRRWRTPNADSRGSGSPVRGAPWPPG